jgi:hypothetical protein
MVPAKRSVQVLTLADESDANQNYAHCPFRAKPPPATSALIDLHRNNQSAKMNSTIGHF